MKNIKLVARNDSISEQDALGLKDESQVRPLMGLSVGNFIQLISMDQQTCLVEVYQNANKNGAFYFIEGSLHNAVCGDLEGEEAAMEMISWEKARININNKLNTNGLEKKIEKGILSLLMESSRRKDKKQILSDLAIAGEIGSGSAPGGTVLVPGDKQIGETERTEEKSPEAGSKSEIVKILEKISGIFEYCVFDEGDILQDKSAESKAIMHIAPSLHFNLSDSLCDLIGGGCLKYLSFSTHGGVRYLLFRLNKSQIVVGLNPGIKPGDFLNRIFTDTEIK